LFFRKWKPRLNAISGYGFDTVQLPLRNLCQKCRRIFATSIGYSSIGWPPTPKRNNLACTRPFHTTEICLVTPQQLAADAIQTNPRQYTAIKAPVLAIIAVPHACAPNCELPQVKALAEEDEIRADAFAQGNPNARVIRLTYANYFVFKSNEADVLRAMNDFMSGLPRR
jgi:hypothetical protein